jgi:hypothetical protein
MTAWLSSLAAGAQPAISPASKNTITDSGRFIDADTPSLGVK